MANGRFAGLRAGALFLVIILALGIGAWAAAIAVMRRPLPAPLYTGGDLPPLPPPDQNGWTVLAKAAHEVALPHLPEAVTALCGERKTPPLARWQAAVAQAGVLATIADAGGPGMARLRAMAARPAFAEACSPDPAAPCPHLALTQLHHLAEADALAAATGHRMAAALGGATALLALDQRFAASVRTNLGAFEALTHLSRTLHLVAILLADPTPSDWQGPAVGPALDALARQVDAFDPAAPDLRRAVVGEYLTFQVLLGSLEARERGRLRHQAGPVAELLYDPADTRRRLDAYFRRMMAFAEAPGKAAPPPLAPQASGALWWLYNPVGKRLLDASVANLGERLAWEAQRRGRLAARVASVRAALRARRPSPPAAPPSAPGDRRR